MSSEDEQEQQQPMIIDIHGLMANYQMMAARVASLEEEIKRRDKKAKSTKPKSKSAPRSLQYVLDQVTHDTMCERPVTIASTMRDMGLHDAAAGYERAWLRHNADNINASTYWDTWFDSWFQAVKK